MIYLNVQTTHCFSMIDVCGFFNNKKKGKQMDTDKNEYDKQMMQ